MPMEDKTILRAFFKVRQPCGSEVTYKDVWCALPDSLLAKICVKTVKNRLVEKGYALEDKLAADDRWTAWGNRGLASCSAHKDTDEDPMGSHLAGGG